jgi:hypothetical protein
MLRYFTFNTSFEILCFLTAMVCLSKETNRVWKGVRIYLFVTCITEVFGIYLKSHHQSNQWPYNILLLFQIGYTSLMFADLLNKYVNSRRLIYWLLLSLLLVYSCETFNHGFLKFNEWTYSSMAVVFVFYSLYFFYLLLNDDHYIKLKSSATFWWVAGSMLFYFGSTAVNIYRGMDPIAKKKIQTISQNLQPDIRHQTMKSISSNANKNRSGEDTVNRAAFLVGKKDRNGAVLTKSPIVNKHSSTYYIYILLNAILYSSWSYSFICKTWSIMISEG